MAATLVLTGTLTVFFAFFVPIIFVAVKQLQSFVAFLPSKIKMLNDFILTHDFYGHQLSDIISIEKLIASTSPFASGIVNQSINITIGFAQGIMFFLAICMIVFYMLADKDVIRNDFIKFFPIKMKEKATMLYDTISHKVQCYVHVS